MISRLRNLSIRALPLCAAAFAGMPCLAQTADPAVTQWGLGVAAGVRQRAYRGDDADKRVLPLPFVDSQWFRLAGTGADLKLPSMGPVTFALRASYQFDGYHSGDAPILAGLPDRKGSVWLGGAATWHDPMADVSLAWLADVSGHSDGQQLRLAIGRGFPMGSFELRPRIGATWLARKYVDYYYGVRADEALPGRPEYTGASTVDAEIGLRTSYRIDRHQSLYLDAGATHLGDSITNSPLVGRGTLGTAALGYLYRF
jgi:outer membrane protein